VSFHKLSVDKDWGMNEVSKHEVIGYRFLPHRVRGEGFFISVMRKLESSDSRRGKVASKLAPAPRKISDELAHWTKNSQTQFFQHHDLVFGVPQSLVQDFNFLINQLRFVYGGTNFATVKHDKLIPEHSLAVSVDLDRERVQNFELDYSTTINYLRRDSIVLEGEKGFALVSYNGNPLGWVNVLGNRVNNLYPQEWRIRMDAHGGQAPVMA
jgi:NOL1/NOP2/fmu family ribosome biogenesis protein